MTVNHDSLTIIRERLLFELLEHTPCRTNHKFRIEVHTVWNFANFCLTLFFVKILKNFRETNAVKVLFSKMTFKMAQFSIFGANLRNFDLFDLIEEGLGYLDPLKPLTPIDPLMSN